MAHPSPQTSFRWFEIAFLCTTVVAATALTCVLAGLPRLLFER